MPRRPSTAPTRRKAPAAGALQDGPKGRGHDAAAPASASAPARPRTSRAASAAAAPARGGGKKAALERAERRTRARGDALPIIDVGAPGGTRVTPAPAARRQRAAAPGSSAPRKAAAPQPAPRKAAARPPARKAAPRKAARKIPRSR
jgi:hypothetical protein